VGLYSLSSSVGWKAGDFAASEVSLAFPFRVGSALIFRLRREFSCRSASILSAAFLQICQLLLHLCLAVQDGGEVRGDASRSRGTNIRLLVHSNFAAGENHLRRKTGTKGVRLVPHCVRQLFLQRTNKMS